jgi:predicted amidohydrolase
MGESNVARCISVHHIKIAHVNAQALTASLLLRWKSRSGLIRRILDAALATPAPRSDVDNPVLPGNLRVAAAQMQMQLCEVDEFVRILAGNVRRAAAAGAQLVVFPEYVGAMLLGMLPAVKGRDQRTSLVPGVKMHELLALISPHVARIMHTTHSTLSKRYGCYIVTGSHIVSEGGTLRSRIALYGPHGERVGAQDKLHPFTTEAEWLQPGESVNVFPIDQLGAKCATSLAMPICMDYTYWETARIAYQQGAEVLIDATFDDDPLSNAASRARGVLMRVQEVPCFGVQCCMVGDFATFRPRGPSAIVAPWQITARKDGVLVQAASATQAELLTCDLDLEALRTFRAERTV